MDNLKKVVPTFVWDYTPVVVFAAGGFWVVQKVGSKLFNYINTKRMLNRWKHSPVDTVIVHTIPPGKTVPNLSPFVIKLETYLRMTNIPYKLDTQYPMDPIKQKTPWITLNGKHYSDSQLIIEFLAKKYEKPIGSYSEELNAIGSMARILLDEHFYWGLVLWRYIYTEARDLHKLYSMPRIYLVIFRKLLVAQMENSCWIQGLGRHSQEDGIKIMCDDLRTISVILGKKKFILGDEPCIDDCAIFGQLSQALWAAPGSPYEKIINDELHNLRDYCIRMKETFWPDWENCLAEP